MCEVDVDYEKLFKFGSQHITGQRASALFVHCWLSSLLWKQGTLSRNAQYKDVNGKTIEN